MPQIERFEGQMRFTNVDEAEASEQPAEKVNEFLG